MSISTIGFPDSQNSHAFGKKGKYLADIMRLCTPEGHARNAAQPSVGMSRMHVALHLVALRKKLGPHYCKELRKIHNV